MSTSDERVEKTPKWASDPFTQLLNDIGRQKELLHVATHGIASSTSATLVAEAACRVRKEPFTDSRRKTAERIATLAKAEVSSGFALLHAQAVVALWHALDNHLRRFLVAWIANEPSAMQAEAIRKLKVRIGDYLAIDEEDRPEFLAEQIDQEIGGPLKLGVTRFESVFNLFGMSGPVDELVKRTVFELQQVRNVIVHRGSKADRHLLDKCPWLPFTCGEEIVISWMTYERFECAVFVYVMELCIRFGRHFNDVGDWCRENADEALTRLREMAPEVGYRWKPTSMDWEAKE